MPNSFRSFSSLNTTCGMLIRVSYRFMLTRTYIKEAHLPNSRRFFAASIVTVL